ncbi:MAG TPA: 2-amino-4-hydroxy-6-hydroxymethyldihydropteridine diphosphokinase [Mycobacteriales bacterium]|nr:2-amino-4-hydroxy-6-hydroxymethyldihydropteridine diphosphokinase [Mycobacteriales bacterium]
MTAVLSIGSNLDDRLAHLQAAVDGLGPAVVAVSPVYRTAPWGGVEQDDFLNAIVLVDDPDAAPAEWLARARAAEHAAGRVRTVRWGPRTLDVDIVTVDGVRSDDPELTLPHPRAAERGFVLLPWLDLQPGATLPGHGPIRSLIDRLPAAERAGLHRTDHTLRLPTPPAAAQPTEPA